MPALETITDELLIKAINGANNRVILISPGVWPEAAQAVADAWHRLGANRVMVILDSTAEICRLGYGSLEGLQILQTAATAVGSSLAEEPGMRICVVIADEKTFIFSPTPRLLEAPPGSDPPLEPSSNTQPLEPAINSPLFEQAGSPPSLEPPGTGPQLEVSQPKANGIILDTPPTTLEKDLGISIEGDSTRILGGETLTLEKLQSVATDLQANPPKKFDLARAVNVYNAKIQFVEFRVEGCRLSEHKARLPKNLLQVIKGNEALSKKIENSIQLLDPEDVLVTDPKLSQGTVFNLRDKIHKDYLNSVDGIGTVIERDRKAEFLKEVKGLQGEVANFSKHVEGILSERFRETANQLAGVLLDNVLTNMPENWKKRLGTHPNPDQVRWKIVDELSKAFGDPAKKVGRMKVETVFKDVTYDMLKDENFRTIVNGYFSDLPLMEEYDAAPESSTASADDQPKS